MPKSTAQLLYVIDFSFLEPYFNYFFSITVPYHFNYIDRRCLQIDVAIVKNKMLRQRVELS
jgi:hypothetical protein